MTNLVAVLAVSLAAAAAPGSPARPQPGQKAPAFSLEASTGKSVTLADYKGHTLVLAFFPKAFTGG